MAVFNSYVTVGSRRVSKKSLLDEDGVGYPNFQIPMVVQPIRGWGGPPTARVPNDFSGQVSSKELIDSWVMFAVATHEAQKQKEPWPIGSETHFTDEGRFDWVICIWYDLSMHTDIHRRHGDVDHYAWNCWDKACGIPVMQPWGPNMEVYSQNSGKKESKIILEPPNILFRLEWTDWISEAGQKSELWAVVQCREDVHDPCIERVWLILFSVVFFLTVWLWLNPWHIFSFAASRWPSSQLM